MADNWNQGFSMPMFRDFVPKRLRPWLYVYLAFTFQLSNGVYLGGMEHMRGSLDLMREDIMMCLYATLCGLAVYFPMLFRTKFRFTNRTLLLFSAGGIAVLSILALHVRLLPVLWVICFFIGVLKLQGTFECMSNIQLWMTPTRDFGVFFPVLHIFIMLSVSVAEVLSVYLSYYVTWEYMSYLMIGIMVFNCLWLFLLTRHVRTMPRMPLLAIDWLGAALWALTVLQIAFVFCYGEYYDWWHSSVIRTVSFTALVTLTLALVRMMMIRHPYIEPKIFMTRGLGRFMLAALVIEAVMATEHVLEGMFYAAGPGWDELQRVHLNVPVMVGVVCACLFGLLWLKVLQGRAVRLIAIGMGAFVGYSLWFYFNVSPELDINRLWLPLFLRGFATTTMGITLLYVLKQMMHFMVFFQSVTVFQCLHLVIGGVVGAAVYSFAVRYFMADHLTTNAVAFDAASFSLASQSHRIPGVMAALQLTTVKRLFGIVTYVAIGVLLLLLLWDIPFTRGMRNKIPSVRTVGNAMRKHLFG